MKPIIAKRLCNIFFENPDIIAEKMCNPFNGTGTDYQADYDQTYSQAVSAIKALQRYLEKESIK